MWPKMFFEILPHIGRLVPMAEKFFATRGARDAEEQATLNDISQTLHTELARVSEVNAGIQQALTTQGEQISATTAEITRVRQGMESVEARIGRLESSFAGATEAAARADRSAARAARLFLFVVVLLAVIVLMLAFLIFRVQGH